MRVVIQRVKNASVCVEGDKVSSIGRGILVLVGVVNEDTEFDIEWLANKIVALRIFDDAEGVMNLNVEQIRGEVLVVSQFTLHASVKKGNRPSYIKAAAEGVAKPLYEKFVIAVSDLLNRPVATGVFGAEMQVELLNDGPVTLFIDSKNRE